MKTDYRNNVDSDVSGPHFDDCENDDAVMDDKSKISSEKTLKTCMDKTEEMPIMRIFLSEQLLRH